MVAELEKIPYYDGSGFQALYLNDNGGVWHFHPECELLLNTAGYGTRIIGDNVELFDKYEMTLISGNIPHCWNYYKVEGKLPENHGIALYFSLSSLGKDLLNQHEMNSVRELLEEAERGIAFSEEDARKAEVHLADMINHTGIDKMIDFFLILKILINAEKRRQLCSENYKLSFEETGNKRMSEVYSYIRENFKKHITLDEVSKIAGMSTFSFSRYFKRNSGAGFVEYLNQVRTNKACYLLRETAYQIQDIAESCGFSSISNFNKQFRKTVGLSPREYRAQFV